MLWPAQLWPFAGYYLEFNDYQFSTSKTPDEKFSEFLLLQVPYLAFRRMTAAKKLTFRLGDREYELTEEQVKGLAKMTKYVSK